MDSIRIRCGDGYVFQAFGGMYEDADGSKYPIWVDEGNDYVLRPGERVDLIVINLLLAGLWGSSKINEGIIVADNREELSRGVTVGAGMDLKFEHLNLDRESVVVPKSMQFVSVELSQE